MRLQASSPTRVNPRKGSRKGLQDKLPSVMLSQARSLGIILLKQSMAVATYQADSGRRMALSSSPAASPSSRLRPGQGFLQTVRVSHESCAGGRLPFRARGFLVLGGLFLDLEG